MTLLQKLAFLDTGVRRSIRCSAGNSPPMWFFRFKVKVGNESTNF